MKKKPIFKFFIMIVFISSLPVSFIYWATIKAPTTLPPGLLQLIWKGKLSLTWTVNVCPLIIPS